MPLLYSRDQGVTVACPRGAPPHARATGRRALGRCAAAAILSAGLLFLARPGDATAEMQFPVTAGTQFPAADATDTIEVSAEAGNRWTAHGEDVWILRGSVRVHQGGMYASAREAVMWIRLGRGQSDDRARVTLFLAGDVVVNYFPEPDAHRPEATLRDRTWFTRLEARGISNVDFRIGQIAGRPTIDVPLLRAAHDRRAADLNTVRRPNPDAPAVKPVQFTPLPAPAEVRGDAPPEGMRRIRVFPRSSAPVQARWFPNRAQNEWIAVINSGVNVIVDGLGDFGSVDLSADRVVMWTRGMAEADFTGQTFQSRDVPLEIYMEGNIVFRQGNREIRAARMFYNVKSRVGIVLDAQIRSPVRDYWGELRVKAGVLRQLDESNFLAQDAALTTSRLGVPSYWFGSRTLSLTDVQRPGEPFGGQATVDPLTGEPRIEHRQLASSVGNTVVVGGVPVFYWPKLETDLQNPAIYINDVTFKSDSVFGNQLLTNWDLYQLLSIRAPEGTEWDLNADYLDERGVAGGTEFRYDRTGGLLGLDGRMIGRLDAWFINDNGFDDLGSDRRGLTPEEENRGRVLWQHRHRLRGGYQITAELGYLTDRNFLEQYFEEEWDQWKDQSTGVELKRLLENQSWNLAVDGRVNDFFTQTGQLPRADHFLIGQSLLLDRVTWSAHTHAGYYRLQTATTPSDPTDAAKFDLLAWEVPQNGERIATRHEIDLPLDVGPFRFVPFALGELAHWGSDLTGDDSQRAYGQTGVRASVPVWRVDPLVEMPLLDVHGLAHKAVFDAEFSYADANRNLASYPLYDPLDDDSVEAFRHRMLIDTFGGTPGTDVPLRYDERFYALRSGLASNVTSPSTEVADDLMALRFGVRQRWQTKRGPPGNRHIVDWIVLDTRTVWFPREDRDNFGQPLGLSEYDFRWHVGDRVTLVSDGMFDFFGQGQRLMSFGAFLNRPPRGAWYAGFRSLEGPISSNVLNSSFTYRLSPKWITSIGSSFDLGKTGNIGQHFTMTRIGESLLVRAGFNIDASRGNFGALLAVEPRFWPKSRLGRIGQSHVLPAGAVGLE